MKPTPDTHSWQAPNKAVFRPQNRTELKNAVNAWMISADNATVVREGYEELSLGELVALLGPLLSLVKKYIAKSKIPPLFVIADVR